MPMTSAEPSRIRATTRDRFRVVPWRAPLLAAGLALTMAALGAPDARAQQGAYRPPVQQAQAQASPSGPLRGKVERGVAEPLPIAIPVFLGADPKLAKDLADVLSADLERSGLFRPLDRAAFLEPIQNFDIPPNFSNWSSIGAQYLVVGRVSPSQAGLGIDVRLWDVLSGRPLDGKRFGIQPQFWRSLSHMAADAVFTKLTGETGYFDTRVVFVDETGPKERRVKRLAIMDQDGANIRLLSQGGDLVLNPRFSPTSQEITYMSYGRSDQGRVMLMNLDTGQREVVGDFQGMTLAPRFSPDGQRVIMSVAQGEDYSIVEMDLRSRQTRKLTQSQQKIDTAPCYSPDGRQIVFESDREGTQQIYVMNADGSNQRRISFAEGRYATPVWSPRGDLIAFTKQSGGGFQIGVMAPDGSGERILTDGFHNEGPTWAPNGRYLMFFRESRGASGGSKLFTIDLTGYNERPIATPAFGSDPAWSPLIH